MAKTSITTEREQMISFIHDNLVDKNGKKPSKKELKTCSDTTLRKICDRFADDFAEYVKNPPVKLQNFFAECTTKDNKEVTVEQKAVDLEDCKRILKESGYTYTKLVSAKGHHLCKYCWRIAEGSYKDLLCDECKRTFGHSLYSEL